MARVKLVLNAVSISSDFCAEEDPLDRELQSRELGRIMASHYPNPTIFLGYVVTKPHVAKRKYDSISAGHIREANLLLSGTIQIPCRWFVPCSLSCTPLMPGLDGKMHDIDQADYDRWCVRLHDHSFTDANHHQV
jgi:hypothetical protein